MILSGSASDGTEGLAAIRAQGGITFAQDPRSARFAEMPQSAVDAGVVDLCLPLPALGAELARLAQHPYLVRSAAAVLNPATSALTEVLAVVQAAILLPKQMQAEGSTDFNQGRREVAIITEPLHDVFITFQSYTDGVLGMDVKLNPLITFVWLGFGLTIAGSALAAWPKRQAA